MQAQTKPLQELIEQLEQKTGKSIHFEPMAQHVMTKERRVR